MSVKTFVFCSGVLALLLQSVQLSQEFKSHSWAFARMHADIKERIRRAMYEFGILSKRDTIAWLWVQSCRL